jgi:hypothetical protein
MFSWSKIEGQEEEEEKKEREYTIRLLVERIAEVKGSE